jgi:hypothetical protein
VPVTGSRSGAEIREGFENGTAVSWKFGRNQSRLSVTLPEALGGRTIEVAFEGGYTFTPLIAEHAAALHAAGDEKTAAGEGACAARARMLD